MTAAGELSNAVTLPIAAPGQAACTNSQLSTTTLSKLDAGGTIKGGGFAVARGTNTFNMIPATGAPTSTTASQETISGVMFQYTAAEYAAVVGLPTIDACTVNDHTTASGTSPGTPDSYLDLGPSIAVAGPKLASNATLARLAGPVYDLVLSNGTIVNGGKYTVTGVGGPDAGPFNASVSFPSSFTVTNWDSITTIDRTKPLKIDWTGGDDQVIFIISTTRTVGKNAANVNIIHSVALTCTVPAAAGTYSIPVAALSYLLPETLDAASLATGSGGFVAEAVQQHALHPSATRGRPS